MKSNEKIILNHSFRFAITIVQCYQNLVTAEKEFVLSKQLLRSGTAIGALVKEAQNAESSRDFIHKLGIAQKECAESQYWLELLRYPVTSINPNSTTFSALQPVSSR